MSAKDAARAASPSAAEAKSKESKNKKEKKDKPDLHHTHDHKHRHSKKSRHGESSEAKSSLSTTTATPNPPVEEEDWEENRAAVERLCAQYPNNLCCDCGESGTRWASVNHGVFVCIRCSGVHRSLGTHISKVKSTNMDRWSLAEVRLMEAIGNAKAKTLYEARLPAGTRPPLSSSGVADDAIKSFIRRKYAEREFAMHNLKDVLGRLYKDTGYGRPPKKSSRAGEAAVSAAGAVHGGREDPPLDRATITGKRGDTMRALYGDNAAEMQRGAAGRKGGGTAGDASVAAAAPKPTYGAFGLVNVPADAYEARWKRTLEVFARVEAAQDPAMEEEVTEVGGVEGDAAPTTTPPLSDADAEAATVSEETAAQSVGDGAASTAAVETGVDGM